MFYRFFCTYVRCLIDFESSTGDKCCIDFKDYIYIKIMLDGLSIQKVSKMFDAVLILIVQQ